MTAALARSLDELTQCGLEGDEPYAADLIKEELSFAQELHRIGAHQHAELVEQTAYRDARAMARHAHA